MLLLYMGQLQFAENVTSDWKAKLTLMVGIGDHFCHHGLHDGDITVECTADEPCKQRNPVRLCHAKCDTAHGDACKADKGHGFTPVDIGDSAPAECRDGLCDGVR